MQLTGRKTPLFCIHPANGEVLVFVNLAKYFVNDRPFYTFRPRGFNEGEQHFETINEIVSTYLNAIRKRQPRGPYALAGYSLRGPIAFELAKVLESQAGRVLQAGPGESVADQIGNLKRMLQASLADPNLTVLFALQ